MRAIEPMQVAKQRRDAALAHLAQSVPYIRHLGVAFDRRGDELTARLGFDEKLIGNPRIPALHGGAIGAFLEIAALMELAWALVWERMEGGGAAAAAIEAGHFPPWPKTIDFTVDYLRAGLPRDAYARGRVNRMGRRYASVHVEAWQDNRARPIAQATGHFLMPEGGGMTRIAVELRNVAGTEAALGWAGAHTLVVDRPDGAAGGGGLGFNGGELLALAIGGCLCNDLRYAAHEMGVVLHEIAVSVALEIGGAPPVAREAVVTLDCRGDDEAAVAAVVARARAASTVANSLARGFPVTIRSARA